MKEKLILIGGGGHCKSCIDVIEKAGKYSVAGIVDIKEKIGEKILNYNIIDSDDNLDLLAKEYRNFFITIGFIKNPFLREKIYNELLRRDIHLPIIISPIAVLSSSALIQDGTIIMHNAVINSEAVIGRNCIINTGAIIEHESQIGFNSHISTSAVVNGQCSIGANCFIGSNSVINNNIKICNNVIIGSGTVVIKTIEESGIYIGNPIRKIG